MGQNIFQLVTFRKETNFYKQKSIQIPTCKVLGRFSPFPCLHHRRHALVKTDPLVSVGSVPIIRTILMIGCVGVTVITTVVVRLGQFLLRKQHQGREKNIEVELKIFLFVRR